MEHGVSDALHFAKDILDQAENAYQNRDLKEFKQCLKQAKSEIDDAQAIASGTASAE